MKTLNIFTCIALVMTAASAFASGYPADYPSKSDEQSIGPITVRRDLQSWGNKIALNVRYAGYLFNPMSGHQDDLSVLVRVHYADGVREGMFHLQDSGNGATVRITNGCLVGSYGGCARMGTREMEHLLFWASGWNGLNALDIEFAFVDGRGRWDSRHGQNYRMHFPAMTAY